MRVSRKVFIRTALGVLGAAVVVALVLRIGVDDIAEQLSKVGVELGLLFVVYGAGTAVIALPWRWLLPPEHRPTISGAIASRFAASGANAVLPLFGFGGEPSRLLWLDARTRAQGIAALVVDRLIFTGAGALILAAGALVALGSPLPLSFVVAAAIAAGGMIAVLGALVWSAREHRLGARLHRLVQRLRRAQAPDGEGVGAEVDGRMRELLALRPRRHGAMLLVHLVGRLFLCAEIYAGLIVLDVPAGPGTALILASVPIALAFVASSVPSQVGVQEGGLALVTAALGFGPAVGLTLVLLQRIRQVFTIALAVALLGTTPWSRRRAATVAGSPVER